MHILEILLLEHKDGLAKELMRPFAIDSIEGYKIPVYRLEINPELVVLIYSLKSGSDVSPSLLDHLFPHLKSIIILSDGNVFNNWNFSEELTDKLRQFSDEVPSVLVISERADREQLPEYILDNGLFLGPKSRMLFLDFSDPGMIKRIWKLALGDLMYQS